MSRRPPRLLAALVVAAVLSACSGGGDEVDPSAEPSLAPQPDAGGSAPAQAPTAAEQASAAPAEAPPGPSPLPTATAGPELAAALETDLGAQVSGITGITSTIDCPDEAAALTDGYTCVAMPEGGGARRVIVRLVEGGYGYQLAINAPLLEEYLVGQVPDAQAIDCPDNIVGAEGMQFECTLTRADGSTAPLRVTQTDAAGNVTQEVLEPPPPPPPSEG